MPAQSGRNVLIKVEDTPGGGTYTAVGGLRTKQFRLSNRESDVSDSESPGAWVEREVGHSLKSLEFSGNGVWKNTTQLKQVVNAVLASQILNYQMVVPGLGTFAGAFAVGNVDMGGPHDDTITFSASFMSAGQIAFTASA